MAADARAWGRVIDGDANGGDLVQSALVQHLIKGGG